MWGELFLFGHLKDLSVLISRRKKNIKLQPQRDINKGKLHLIKGVACESVPTLLSSEVDITFSFWKLYSFQLYFHTIYRVIILQLCLTALHYNENKGKKHAVTKKSTK